MAIITRYAKKIMIDNQYALSHNYIKSLSNTMDINLYKVWNKAYTFVSDDQINQLSNLSNKYKYHFADSSSKTLNRMKLLFQNESIIDEAYLYFPRLDFLLSTRGSFDSRYFFNLYYKYTDYTDKFWDDTVYHRNFMKLLPATRVRISENNQKKHTRVLPMVINIANSIYDSGILVINIKEDEIYGIFDSSHFPKRCNLHIINVSDNVIISSTDISKTRTVFNISPKDLNLTNHITETEIRLNDQDYLATYKKSALDNLYYIALIPKNDLFDDINRFSTTMLILIIVFALAGLLASAVFTNHIYSPLGDLIKYMGSFFSVPKNVIVNEYDFIKANISNIYNQQQKSNSSFIQMLFFRAINGEFFDPNVSLLKNNYGILADDTIGSIITIYVGFSIEWDNLISSRKNEIITSFKEILNLFCPPLETAPQQYTMLLNTINLETLNQLFEDLCNAISVFLDAHAQYIDIIISKSDAFRNLYDCKKYYQQTNEIITKRGISQSKLYYTSKDIVPDSNNKLINNYEKERLITYLDNGCVHEIEEYLSQVFLYVRNLNINYKDFKQIVNELNILLLDFIYSNKIAINEIWTGKRDIHLCIRRMINVGDLEQLYINLYTKTCELINARHAENTTIAKILDYIDNNLTTVYIDDLASYVGMNPSYISQYFKKHTGITFTAYVNKMRIDYAKKLLSNTDEMIQDIGLKVGFQNSNSFIRMFKKHEGITPSIYRKRFTSQIIIQNERLHS